MISLLAQQTGGAGGAEVETVRQNMLEVLSNVFSRADTLAHPEDLLSQLQSLSVVWAMVLLTGGIICLLHGYRFYKTVTIVLALTVGAVAGYYLGMRIDQPLIVAGCFGVLLAVVAFPMMKFAVAALGGLTGAFLGANAWAAVARLIASPEQAEVMAQNYWVGALIGLLVCGMLAFVLFKLSVVLFTSVSGSTLAVLGAVALLLQVPALRETVSDSVSAHSVIIPMLVIVPAVIGLILQESRREPAPAKGSS